MSEPVGNGPRGAIPGNSHKDREVAPAAPEPREKVEKIVQGKVVERRSPWYKRAARNMIADDAQTIGGYIVDDVLVPAIRNLVFDIITQAAGRALYPGGRAGIRHTQGSVVRGSAMSIRTKYENMSTGSGGDPRPQISREARAVHDFREITLTDRSEAIAVVEALISRIEQYGQTTVSDFYDLVGTTGSYTDRNWGWTDLATADVRQHRGGWLLDLPRPVQLRS